MFSVSGDAFLRGQVRKLVGLALAITRGWLPEWYLDVAVKCRTGDSVCDIPSVPKEGLSLAECRYVHSSVFNEGFFSGVVLLCTAQYFIVFLVINNNNNKCMKSVVLLTNHRVCRYSLWETKHNLWMDPRRELAALQIAATQQANATTAAAIAAAALLSAQCNEESGRKNGDVDFSNICAINYGSSSNAEGEAQDITTMSVQSPISLSVPMPMPIAATIITSQGVFTATHNPRSANRINLLNPHAAPVPTPASTESSSTITDPQTMLDGRDTYSVFASSAVSTEGARVVSNVNIMESWRSMVQSHAVRLMNQRGDE